jgi:hypothetical protein
MHCCIYLCACTDITPAAAHVLRQVISDAVEHAQALYSWKVRNQFQLATKQTFFIVDALEQRQLQCEDNQVVKMIREAKTFGLLCSLQQV